ncbi:hypothetical protein Taro_033845 [Colocasia esculenta]|uniref:Aminotransferase-like plant mobile domain-containing protein n=1 Tax=Colocasia esculenta TaxID=4460 RepID=A0A843W180_COLES|nr:hypothetical protein [Colocasia esculenta]
MRAWVSWLLVLAVYLAFPTFQRERLEEMGFGEIHRMDRMRPDPALTQALRSRWDSEATTFVLPWGHMIPSLEDVSRITGLRVYGWPVSGFTYPGYSELAHRLLGLTVVERSSLLSRVELQESLGLYEVGKKVGETADGQLQWLTRWCWTVFADEPGAETDLDLRRFLILFLGRVLFATRGDAVHCRFLPFLEELDKVGGYAWGAAFLAHQFDSLSASERQTSTSGFFPFLQVWTYLHLPTLRRGILARPGLVPIAHRWDPRRDARTLSDQLASLQEAIDCYPHLDVVWQPYLEEGDEGQPWLVQARPYFGRSRSLGLRQSAVEFPSRDRTPRPGRSFQRLHDTTDWRERAKEQIQNWERRGKGVKSSATTDDAYLQAYALKYGGKVDVAGETTSLRALLHSAMQDREVAQREVEQLRRELERVSRAATAGASSFTAAEDPQSDLEDRLAAAVRRAKETQTDLPERETALRSATDRATELQRQVDSVKGERDQLHIRAEAAEARVAKVTRELATLRVQGSSVEQEELVRLRTDLQAQQTLVRGLQEVMTAIGRSRSRSRSGASGASGATGASVRQYLAGSSNCRRNEEEERRHRGEASAQSGRGGGEMR